MGCECKNQQNNRNLAEILKKLNKLKFPQNYLLLNCEKWAETLEKQERTASRYTKSGENDMTNNVTNMDTHI